jgi:hypothetical protein
MIRMIWEKMMKWGWDYNRNLRDNSIGLVDDIINSIDLPDPITFRVQMVSGGTVVETRWYDHKKDNNITKLHIVTSEENLAESIGKIVTMELLQK